MALSTSSLVLYERNSQRFVFCIKYTFKQGPCGGAKCNQVDHCRRYVIYVCIDFCILILLSLISFGFSAHVQFFRFLFDYSQYGFCGPGETYCNEKAIWTKDCPTPVPSSGLSVAPSSKLHDSSPASLAPSTLIPTAVKTNRTTESPDGGLPPTVHPSAQHYQKPSGYNKPGGGKGSVPKPARTHPPTTSYPTKQNPKPPSVAPTSRPTIVATSSPASMVDSFFENPQPTRSPTSEPTPDSTLLSSNAPSVTSLTALPSSDSLSASPTSSAI